MQRIEPHVFNIFIKNISFKTNSIVLSSYITITINVNTSNSLIYVCTPRVTEPGEYFRPDNIKLSD
jgi:hypothetical protein